MRADVEKGVGDGLNSEPLSRYPSMYNPPNLRLRLASVKIDGGRVHARLLPAFMRCAQEVHTNGLSASGN